MTAQIDWKLLRDKALEVCSHAYAPYSGFPVGAAYQRNASALIRSDVLPGLDSIATATAARTGDEVDRGARAQLVLWGPALVALGLIGAASVWLTRRTRRVVNVGLAIAALAVLGFTGFASTQQSVLAWQGLVRPPDHWWTIATLMDAYFGFITSVLMSLVLFSCRR